MRRALALITLAACGITAAAAASPAAAARQAPLRLAATPHLTPGAGGARAALGLAPLSATGGAGTVNGTVSAFDGSPIEGAQVYAGWRDGTDITVLAPETTDAAGYYSVSGMPGTSQGLLEAVLPSDDYFLSKGLLFSDPGPTTFDLRPGSIGFTTTRSTSSWGTWSSLALYTSGSGGEARTLTGNVLSGTAWAMAPEVDYAVAYYWSNEASEVSFASPTPLTPGTDAGVTADFKEGSAFRMWIAKPYWASGKPGSVLELRYSGWPAGTVARFLGAPTYPESATPTSFGGKQLVSAGPSQAVTKVTVPTTAKPGYIYVVEMYRPQDPVWIDLAVFFQVSTLNASKTSVRSGGAVKLSGVVPVSGHIGATPGAPVTVTIYRRTTSATSPPPAWDATTRGWSRVGSYKTNGLGAFHTGYVHPKRTTWYVARYTARPPYVKAYTSVRKVRVY
jgi:hypothetical protein